MLWQLFGTTATPDNQTTRPPDNQPTVLNFWGVFDDPTVFQPIIATYQAAHPNVTINYSRQEADLYEFVSLNLLASQNGPDVWLIPADWLPKHADKLATLPEGWLAAQAGQVPKRKLFGKPETTPANAALFGQLFAPVTADNNLADGQVKAVPLSVDTLGLFGNSQLLTSQGITELPKTWEEVVTVAKKIAKRSTLSYVQPAINLGTSHNVSRASDILAALMIQNHTPMIDEAKQAALFNQTTTKATGEPVQPGPIALDFYTSFASPTKENYSWSAKEPNDFELFSQGKLPLLIDYSYRVADIRQKLPNFPLATAPLPQVSLADQPKTLASALVVGVPVVSKQPAAAWQFVQFLTNKDNSLAYSRAAGRPPARLELAAVPPADPALQPFIVQLASATSWYRNEINQTSHVFNMAIEAVLAGQKVNDVIDKMTKQVNHILRNEPYE